MSWLAQTTSAPVCCYHPAPGMRLDGIDGVTDTPAMVNGVVYFGAWHGEVHLLERHFTVRVGQADGLTAKR